MSSSATFVPERSLSSTEGALVSVSIRVDPRGLESLLEALAEVGFPINPQIYHQAEIAFVRAGGLTEAAETTLVEFPAYLGRVDEVYGALEAHGFERNSVLVTSMLEELRSPASKEAPGAEMGWAVVSRRSHGGVRD